MDARDRELKPPRRTWFGNDGWRSILGFPTLKAPVTMKRAYPKRRYTSAARRDSWRAWLPNAVLACHLVGCSTNPAQPRQTDSTIPYTFAVDQWPTFSNDGKTIAYHRVLASTDGPPGVYVVSVAGGRPRLVAESDRAWPRHLRFSPDDSKIVCDWSQLTVIDVATGNLSIPLYTDNRVYSPAWSRDGERIAYLRTLRNYDEPLDSVGTHLYSFTTGLDQVMRQGVEIVGGSWPHWSADGSLFAYLGNHTSGKTAVYVVTPDSIHHVAAVATGWWFERFQWFRTTSGEDRLFIVERTFEGTFAGLVARPDGGVMAPRLGRLSYFDTVSEDGRRFVLVRGQPTDSMGVLFVQEADGRQRPRQLTAWHPLLR